MSIENSEAAEVGIDELTKALDTLSDLVKSDSPDDRKNDLLVKAQNGDLDEAETVELTELLKGGVAVEETLSEDVLRGLDPENNEVLAKSIEVSEYLQAHHGGTIEALDRLTDEISKSGSASLNFSMVLAKAVAEIGHSVQNLEKSLDAVLGQPVSGGRAARTPAQVRPIEKSFATREGTAGAPQIDRETVLNSLEAMNQASENGMSKSGVDLTQAIAKYESTGKLQKSLKGDLVNYLQARAGGQG